MEYFLDFFKLKSLFTLPPPLPTGPGPALLIDRGRGRQAHPPPLRDCVAMSF
jgi:hypothetical protein